jgi:hypothetical protein
MEKISVKVVSKIKNFFIAFVAMLCIVTSISSCNAVNSTFTKPVECEIYFRKNSNVDSEEYEDSVFNLNTKIYIHFKFTLKNVHIDGSEIFTFTAYIPGAQYFERVDFIQGDIVPLYSTIQKPGEDGVFVNTVVLSGMSFEIKKDTNLKPKEFVFEIVAKEACQGNVEAFFDIASDDNVIKYEGEWKEHKKPFTFKNKED